MPIVTGAGASVQGIRRKYEAYTYTPAFVNDNDLVYVTVIDITGRGILVDIAAEGDKSVTVHLLVDGATVFEQSNLLNMKGTGAQTMTIFQGFSTSCKVEMKLAAIGAVSYRAGALVE